MLQLHLHVWYMNLHDPAANSHQVCVVVAVPGPEPKIQHVVSHVLCIASANGLMYSKCMALYW